MTDDLAVVAPKQADLPAWGHANPYRGLTYSDGQLTTTYTDHAKAFVKVFPIGTYVSTREFDEWLQERGLLTIPPDDVSKSSDAWLGHLQRRYQHKDKINKAATHPRMMEQDSLAFIVIAFAGGYEVRAPEQAINHNELAKSIQKLTETKRRQLKYLMQSADWSTLPPLMLESAETVLDAVTELEQDTKTAVDRIDNKVTRLMRRLQASIDAGNDGASSVDTSKQLTSK